jgi:hypothetical protein
MRALSLSVMLALSALACERPADQLPEPVPVPGPGQARRLSYSEAVRVVLHDVDVQAGHHSAHVGNVGGCFDVISLLLQHGADPALTDWRGRTARDYAPTRSSGASRGR